MDESDEDFQRSHKRPATSKQQWENWHHTTVEIYKLIQQQLNMRKNLRYGEFITEICLTTGKVYTNTNSAYFKDLWDKLTDDVKDSYERQAVAKHPAYKVEEDQLIQKVIHLREIRATTMPRSPHPNAAPEETNSKTIPLMATFPASKVFQCQFCPKLFLTESARRKHNNMEFRDFALAHARMDSVGGANDQAGGARDVMGEASGQAGGSRNVMEGEMDEAMAEASPPSRRRGYYGIWAKENEIA